MDAKVERGGTGLPSAEWEQLFRKADVLVDRLNMAKSTRAKATCIGNFLTKHVGKVVTVEIDGRPCRAVLRRADGRSRQVSYYFEVTREPTTESPAPQPDSPAVSACAECSTVKEEKIAPAPQGEASPKTNCQPMNVQAEGNSEEW